MMRMASSMTSRLRRPRKSILSRPSFSTSPIGYCVDELGVLALLLQRQVLDQLAIADHDARGVDRVGAHQPFERTGHVDDLPHELVLVVGLAQLLVRLIDSSKPTLTPSGTSFAMRSTAP